MNIESELHSPQKAPKEEEMMENLSEDLINISNLLEKSSEKGNIFELRREFSAEIAEMFVFLC